MFRISQFMRLIANAERSGVMAPVRHAKPPGPVVIWNLIRRCNLTCKHCYALSADHDYAGELSFDEVCTVMDDLQRYRVPVLILSGGEPLLRADLFEIAARAKAQRFYVGLSTNGTLIDAPMADRVAAAGFDYVGISLDGMQTTHDKFRRMQGAFSKSLAAVQLLVQRGVKVGLRFTMTALNAHDLPALLQLMRDEQVSKFYFSHLNYAGRGNIHRAKDAQFTATRNALDLLFARAGAAAWEGSARGAGPPQAARTPTGGGAEGAWGLSSEEYVTGNNDADGPYLLQWVQRRFPQWSSAVREHLVAWGGNSSGVNVANIDNLGNVHPDTMWWHHTLGNVRSRAFSEIWADTSDALMAGLKAKPRPVQGRCASCMHFNICGGNTRVRAQQVTGNAWAEDPGCYLGDAEIGCASAAERVRTTPFTHVRIEHARSV